MPDPTTPAEPGNDEMLASAGLALPVEGTTQTFDPEPVAESSRPDITKAQIIAGIPIVAEFGHAFGIYNLSQPQQDSLSHAVTWALGLIAADAAIRFGRNLWAGLKSR